VNTDHNASAIATKRDHPADAPQSMDYEHAFAKAKELDRAEGF